MDTHPLWTQSLECRAWWRDAGIRACCWFLCGRTEGRWSIARTCTQDIGMDEHVLFFPPASDMLTSKYRAKLRDSDYSFLAELLRQEMSRCDGRSNSLFVAMTAVLELVCVLQISCSKIPGTAATSWAILSHKTIGWTRRMKVCGTTDNNHGVIVWRSWISNSRELLNPRGPSSEATDQLLSDLNLFRCGSPLLPISSNSHRFRSEYKTAFIHNGKCQSESVCTEASWGCVELVWSGC